MKGFFKKTKKLEHGHLRDIAGMSAVAGLLIVAALFIADGGMTRVNNFLAVNNILPGSQKASVVSVTIDQWYVDPSPVPSGTSANLYYSSTNADTCYFSGGWYGDSVASGDQYNSNATWPGANCATRFGHYTCSQPSQNGNHGYAPYGTGVLTSNTAYYIRCINGGSNNNGDSGWVGMTATVGAAADNCPAAPTAVTNGLQLPSGTYHIVAQGSDFCISNGSGHSVFVPTNTATEVNNFKAATQGYLSGSIAYFARAAGH